LSKNEEKTKAYKVGWTYDGKQAGNLGEVLKEFGLHVYRNPDFSIGDDIYIISNKELSKEEIEIVAKKGKL
jgi:hypothetical protein